MTIHKIPNQIIKKSLTPLNLSKVTGIALHHMAHNKADVKEVERWHINKNYIAIGYNYWIGFDGTVYEGRGLNEGAHTLGYNTTVIGIGFQGNYHESGAMPANTMSEAQFNAGVDLIAWLQAKIPTIVKVAGHSGFQATTCPGNTFPLYKMVLGQKIEKTGSVKMIYNYIDENMPEWARESVQWALDNNILRRAPGDLRLDDKALENFCYLHRTYQLLK